MTSLNDRIAKHVRVNLMNMKDPATTTPPILILFIISTCNMKCEHCFYWQELNQKDDLSYDEICALSDDLGRVEQLYLSGGEPFLRKEFGEICLRFIDRNHTREIYSPTNGYYTDRTIAALRKILSDPRLESFGVEISLDGMPAFHDEFRKTKYSFSKAMETYDALAALQEEDPRVHIYSISTATETNMDEFRKLTTFLFDRCPKMTHHHLAIIRGERKNPGLQGPKLEEYRALSDYMRRLWAPRDAKRQGSIVDPMLQRMKVETARAQRQINPCQAGRHVGVVYANGDVSLCEQREPLGNLRKATFREIWGSQAAKDVRCSIQRKECWCTNEMFMWPSIVYNPPALAATFMKAKPWRAPEPLRPHERQAYTAEEARMEHAPPKPTRTAIRIAE
jgi:MoaA/NifB/PqqE/SkfB family radical SAM enzyme